MNLRPDNRRYLAIVCGRVCVISATERSLLRDRRTRFPSGHQLAKLHRMCELKFPLHAPSRDLSMRESRKRKVSNMFAAEMRKRGWLHEEGYGVGSWADPRNAT